MQTAKELQANQAIAKEVAGCLDKHYPGHAWAVNANVIDGVVRVHNLKLSGEMGFIIKMDALINDPTMKLVISYGGELLERYKVKRGELDQDELDNSVVDFKGDMIYDS